MTTTGLSPNRRHLLLGAVGLGLPLGLSTAAFCASSALPSAQALLGQIVADRRLPGLSLAVQTPGGPARFVQAGTLDFNSPIKVTSDSLASIYSMTKLITGAATAMLIEDGILTLDQPIGELVPELASPEVFVRKDRHLITERAHNPITVRNLLTHTAGFAGDQSRDSPIHQLYRQHGLSGPAYEAGSPANLDDYAERLGQLPLQSQPGSQYDYGPSLNILGLVIQRASGMAFPDLIRSRLLEPLGMTDTGWQLRRQDQSRLMALYRYESGQPPQPVTDAGAEHLMKPVSLYLGGSGLLSSASDYLKFMAMLLKDGDGLMSPQTARLIRSDILPPNLSANGGGHGFGGWVARAGHARTGEFGWSGNASTQAWVDSARGFTAVLMMQALPYRVVDVLTPLRAALDHDLGIIRT